MGAFFDMHCHLGFSSNLTEAAALLARLGAGAFAVCVTPSETQDTASRLGQEAPCVRVGVGLHPWWIADGRIREEEIEAASVLARKASFVGEAGLDFGRAHAHAASVQLSAFERVARACAEGSGEGAAPKVLSLHAVRAADAVLDILERTGAIEGCTCIFHWYSDTPEALQRAIGLGCRFSLGVRSLDTRRGREYARQIPVRLLLLETDEPPEGGPYDVEAAQRQLAHACKMLEEIKGEPVARSIAQSSCELLGLGARID